MDRMSPATTCHSVVDDLRRPVLGLEHDIASLGPQRHAHHMCELVDAGLHLLQRVVLAKVELLGCLDADGSATDIGSADAARAGNWDGDGGECTIRQRRGTTGNHGALLRSAAASAAIKGKRRTARSADAIAQGTGGKNKKKKKKKKKRKRNHCQPSRVYEKQRWSCYHVHETMAPKNKNKKKGASRKAHRGLTTALFLSFTHLYAHIRVYTYIHTYVRSRSHRDPGPSGRRGGHPRRSAHFRGRRSPLSLPPLLYCRRRCRRRRRRRRRRHRSSLFRNLLFLLPPHHHPFIQPFIHSSSRRDAPPPPPFFLETLKNLEKYSGKSLQSK